MVLRTLRAHNATANGERGPDTCSTILLETHLSTFQQRFNVFQHDAAFLQPSTPEARQTRLQQDELFHWPLMSMTITPGGVCSL